MYETSAPGNRRSLQTQLYSSIEDQRNILRNNASIFITILIVYLCKVENKNAGHVTVEVTEVYIRPIICKSEVENICLTKYKSL